MGLHCASVRRLNGVPSLEAAEEGPFGHPECDCPLREEAPGHGRQLADVARCRALLCQWRSLRRIILSTVSEHGS
jgi:hypothetical protein